MGSKPLTYKSLIKVAWHNAILHVFPDKAYSLFGPIAISDLKLSPVMYLKYWSYNMQAYELLWTLFLKLFMIGETFCK